MSMFWGQSTESLLAEKINEIVEQRHKERAARLAWLNGVRIKLENYVGTKGIRLGYIVHGTMNEEQERRLIDDLLLTLERNNQGDGNGR